MSYPTWNNSTWYNRNFVVQYLGSPYISLVSSNYNRPPNTTTGVWWNPYTGPSQPVLSVRQGPGITVTTGSDPSNPTVSGNYVEGQGINIENGTGTARTVSAAIPSLLASTVAPNPYGSAGVTIVGTPFQTPFEVQNTGVTGLRAGTNVTLSSGVSAGGTYAGVVTVNATGGGGGGAVSSVTGANGIAVAPETGAVVVTGPTVAGDAQTLVSLNPTTSTWTIQPSTVTGGGAGVLVDIVTPVGTTPGSYKVSNTGVTSNTGSNGICADSATGAVNLVGPTLAGDSMTLVSLNSTGNPNIWTIQPATLTAGTGIVVTPTDKSGSTPGSYQVTATGLAGVAIAPNSGLDVTTASGTATVRTARTTITGPASGWLEPPSPTSTYRFVFTAAGGGGGGGSVLTAVPRGAGGGGSGAFGEGAFLVGPGGRVVYGLGVGGAGGTTTAPGILDGSPGGYTAIIPYSFASGLLIAGPTILQLEGGTGGMSGQTVGNGGNGGAVSTNLYGTAMTYSFAGGGGGTTAGYTPAGSRGTGIGGGNGTVGDLGVQGPGGTGGGNNNIDYSATAIFAGGGAGGGLSGGLGGLPTGAGNGGLGCGGGGAAGGLPPPASDGGNGGPGFLSYYWEFVA